MLKKRMIIMYCLIGLILVIAAGTSFAYMRTTATQTDENKITTANCLQIDFVGDDVINISNAYPMRDADGLEQIPYTFTISNLCAQNIEVSLGFESLQSSDIPMSLVKGVMARQGHISETTPTLLSNYPNGVAQNNGAAKILLIDNIPGLTSKTFEYVMWVDYSVTYNDISADDVFNGKVIATYALKTNPTFTKYCYTSDYTPGGTLAAGKEFVNGQYTYHYKEDLLETLENNSYVYTWESMTEDGWGVALTDRTTTVPITSEMCTFVNDKPVVSYNYLFSAVTSVPSVDFSSYNTSYVTKMFATFSVTPFLTDTSVISNWDTSNVTTMRSMFYGTSFANVDGLANWDTSNVTTMRSMFCENSTLSNVDGLANWNTSKVTNMSAMFYESTNLSDIDGLANWDTSHVTDMSKMFYQTNLVDLDSLSNWDTSNVTDMSILFKDNHSLESMEGIENWDVRKVQDLSNFFSNCYSLEEIDLSNWATPSLTSIYNAFAMWDSSSQPYLNGNLKRIILSNKFDTSHVTDMFSLVSNDNKLENYDFLLYIRTNSATALDQMFLNNTNAVTLDLSNWNTANVTSMSSMFQGCSNLTTVYASDWWSTANVTSSANMFKGATKIKNYRSTYLDKTRAHYNTNGYLTYKAHD